MTQQAPDYVKNNPLFDPTARRRPQPMAREKTERRLVENLTWVTVEGLCAHFKIGVSTFYRKWSKAGIPELRDDGVRRFPLEKVEAWLEARTRKSKP